MKPQWVLAGAVCLVGAVWWYGSSQREAGRREARLEAVTREEVRAAAVVRQRDTVFIARTDTLRRQLKLWDSVRVTDTLTVYTPGRPESVTVFVPRAVADTAIQLCTRTLSSCDASLRARDSLLTLKDAHIRSLEALKAKRCKLGVGLGVGGGIDWQRKPTIMAGAFWGLSC